MYPYAKYSMITENTNHQPNVGTMLVSSRVCWDESIDIDMIDPLLVGSQLNIKHLI